MKRLILLITLLVGFSGSILQAQTPVKKVLLEEFTGSWCGWCPRGIWAIEQLEAKYPNQFIPVAFHNGDPMVVPEGNTLEATVPGYPDGWVDRLPQPAGTLNTDPTQWDSIVTARLNDPVVAGVSVKNVTYDPVTRAISGDVVVNFAANASGDIRLNMYLVEDSVSGPAGSTWDQHNYLTGQAGYQDNPFYNLPSVVPGYQHMHVIRYVFGGAWGVSGIVPATVAKGSTYTKTFTYTLPMNMKPDQCHLVGLAFAYGTAVSQNIIYNADEVPLTNLPLITGFAATAPALYNTIPRSMQNLQIITLANTGSNDLQVNVAIDGANSVIPKGWQGTISSPSVTVPAKSTMHDTLILTTTANAGYASVSVNVLPISSKAVAHLTPLPVNSLAAGTKYAAFGVDGFTESRMPAPYSADFASLPLDANVMAAYPPESFDVGIFPNVNYFYIDGVDGFPPPVVPAANALLDAGKKVFITSTYGMYYALDPAAPYSTYTNGDAQTFFSSRLGVDYVALKGRSSGNNPTQTSVTGIAGDPVGNGISFKASFYQTDVFTINNSKTTNPVIYLDNKTSTIGGFRYDNGSGQRAVYLDMNFGLVSGTANVTGATKLMSQSMDFLVNGISSVKTSDQATSVKITNYPNPVSKNTTFNYSLTERGTVNLAIYDVLGRQVSRLVSNETEDLGTYTADFDASHLAAGSYTYILTSGTNKVTGTMTVTK